MAIVFLRILMLSTTFFVILRNRLMAHAFSLLDNPNSQVVEAVVSMHIPVVIVRRRNDSDSVNKGRVPAIKATEQMEEQGISTMNIQFLRGSSNNLRSHRTRPKPANTEVISHESARLSGEKPSVKKIKVRGMHSSNIPPTVV